MITYIKNSPEAAGHEAGMQQGTPLPTFVRREQKKRRDWAAVRAASIIAILALGLFLSVKTDYLFFKELLIASAIIGMVVFLKALRHPAILVSREADDKAHLN